MALCKKKVSSIISNVICTTSSAINDVANSIGCTITFANLIDKRFRRKGKSFLHTAQAIIIMRDISN